MLDKRPPANYGAFRLLSERAPKAVETLTWPAMRDRCFSVMCLIAARAFSLRLTGIQVLLRSCRAEG